jgi:hypothetical protein
LTRAVPSFVTEDREKEHWYFWQGWSTSSCVEHSRRAEIRVSVLLAVAEARSNIHQFIR